MTYNQLGRKVKKKAKPKGAYDDLTDEQAARMYAARLHVQVDGTPTKPKKKEPPPPRTGTHGITLGHAV